ncbi:MAG: cupin domain-containing protein [Gemmatimonadetes bacterium]|nr:cupin domain-containing protein [Gemmatimonadota bacterium]
MTPVFPGGPQEQGPPPGRAESPSPTAGGGDPGGPDASFQILNWFTLEWQEEASHGVRFGYRTAPLAEPLGARKLGYHAEILPPGKASVPYHLHLVNEELFIVLGGEMSVRLDSGEHRLRAGDLVAVPPGPGAAHQLLNRTDRPAHFLAASTMIPRDVVDYPDSGKRLLEVEQLAGPAARAAVRLEGGRWVAGSLEGAVANAEYFAGELIDEPLDPVPAPPLERDRRVVSMDEIPWERIAPGGRFSGEAKRVGRKAGTKLLGCSLMRLQPGEQPFPFHFHHVNEEFFYVRSGTGELRTRDGLHRLRPGDAFACLPGPAGAHAIRNTGAAPLEYLALSSMEDPEVSEYPDAGRIYVMVGSAPGGDPAQRSVAAVFRMRDAVDYAAPDD